MSTETKTRGKKNKIDEKKKKQDDGEPSVRKLTKLVPISEGAVLAIEEEAEHDKAECSDEERIRQEDNDDEDSSSEAETEIVPPSIDELDEDAYDGGYQPEAPMTADEFMDGLLTAADSSKVFKEVYFPALKKKIVKVRKYELPWYDEPTCTNERFCTDNACDTSNCYPVWAWCVLRCGMKSKARNTGLVAITFEPVARRIYVMVDEHRFGKPIQLVHPQGNAEARKMDVDRVVFEVRKKLEHVAAHSNGLTDTEFDD